MVIDLQVNMTLQGTSGKTYLFNLYGFDDFDQLKDAFNSLAAIYIFSRRYLDGNTFRHQLLYLGQTKDLSTRYYNHHKMSEIMSNHGNCIWIHVFNGTDIEREEIEKDMLLSYDFPCNDINN